MTLAYWRAGEHPRVDMAMSSRATMSWIAHLTCAKIARSRPLAKGARAEIHRHRVGSVFDSWRLAAKTVAMRSQKSMPNVPANGVAAKVPATTLTPYPASTAAHLLSS